MTGICKADQFQYVYRKQPDFCNFSLTIVSCPNVKLVLITIFFMSENRSFQNPDFKFFSGISICPRTPQGGCLPSVPAKLDNEGYFLLQIRSNNSYKFTNILNYHGRFEYQLLTNGNLFVFSPDTDDLIQNCNTCKKTRNILIITIWLGCQVFYFRKRRPVHRDFFIESEIFTHKGQ